MWRTVENSDSIKPSEIDKTSSKKYVYIRKDFEEISNTEDTGTHWRYLEDKILKSNWEIYERIINAGNDITDIQLAICDLYEMIGG